MEKKQQYGVFKTNIDRKKGEWYNKMGDSMFEYIENLEIINALYGVSVRNKKFTNRPYHALVFKIDGESDYAFPSENITLSAGNVLFIPKGESYTVTQASAEESHYAVINFIASLPAAGPCLYHGHEIGDVRQTVDRIIWVSLFHNLSGKFEMISLFYKMLSVLCQNDRKPYLGSQTRSMIKPATDYLENAIFSTDLKIGDLHTMCNMSDTYFRKIFIAVFGTSPKKYVLNKRLIQARNILESGEYTHVYEVANAVGFRDALYFSKAFKNTYGYFPSKKERLNESG